MATSGNYTWTPSTYGPGVGYPNRAKITWNATWNQSAMLWTVNWNATAQGASTAGRWTTVYGSNNGCNSYITVTDANGNVLQTKSIVAKMETVKNDTVLLEGSFNVGVDVYGNQSLTFAGQINFETTGSAGISSGSQAFALDNIPLASTISSISPSSVAVTTSGGAVTVNIARNNNAYTHTVVWAFGSHSQTQTGQGTSASYTIPASWLDAIPNAASGSATVTVTTYSGSTQIGNPTTASFTITAAVNPSIGSVSVSPSGNPSGITQYIAGYTKAAISASSVSGVQGSTIKKVEFLNGSTVLSSNTTPSYSYTTGAVSGSSATFGVRVTDSRGKTATKSASAVTIAAYAVPTIYANAYRSDSSGTAQTDGTYLKVTASATATPSGTGGNSITALKYSYKATTSSSWSAEADIPSGAVSGFANTTSYDVRVRAQDAIGNSSYKYFTIPTAEYTMDFKVGGDGVAFGKVAENANTLDVAWKLHAREQITSDNPIRLDTAGNTGLIVGINDAQVATWQTARLAVNGVYHVTNWLSLVYSYNETTGAPLSTYETYRLPPVEGGLTNSVTYHIWTTKVIPEPPTTNGTYTLRATVNNGTVTYSWV